MNIETIKKVGGYLLLAVGAYSIGYTLWQAAFSLVVGTVLGYVGYSFAVRDGWSTIQAKKDGMKILGMVKKVTTGIFHEVKDDITD